MPEQVPNKTRSRWQLGVILGFEAVLSAAALWVGFQTGNWPPVIAVLVCAAMIALLMIYSVRNANKSVEE